MCCKTNISAGFMSDDDLVNSDGSNGKEFFLVDSNSDLSDEKNIVKKHKSKENIKKDVTHPFTLVDILVIFWRKDHSSLTDS